MNAVGRLARLALVVCDITAWGPSPDSTASWCVQVFGSYCSARAGTCMMRGDRQTDKTEKKKEGHLAWLTWVALTNRVGRSRLSRELLERAPLKPSTAPEPELLEFTKTCCPRENEREENPWMDPESHVASGRTRKGTENKVLEISILTWA